MGVVYLEYPTTAITCVFMTVQESHSETTQETGSDVYYMMKNSSAS